MTAVEGQRVGSVLLLTLNRPERLNALDRDMLQELDGWIDRASAHSEVRTVVLTGAGSRAFCAGADITMLSDLTQESAYEVMRYGQSVLDRLQGLSKPVLAAINGYALGGGCELALAADLRFAADDAMLAQPEILLANLPGWGGTQRLPILVGPARAKEMIFSGKMVDAATAYGMGLVNQIHPKSELLSATLQYAALLAEKAPLALALAKEAIHIGLERGAEAGMDAEARAVARCWGTSEQQRALADFLAQRRRPSESPSGATDA